MLVLSILMPYACGKVSEAELEALFDKTHRGQLQIDRARLGAMVGSQGFWGVSLLEPGGRPILRGDLILPSVGQFLASMHDSSVIELRLDLVELREVSLGDHQRTSNLHLALSGPDRVPGEDAPGATGEDGDSELEDYHPIQIETTDGGKSGLVQIHFDGGDISSNGSPRLELEGKVTRMVWRDPDDVPLLTMSSPDLGGSIRGAEGDEAGTVAVIELRGELKGHVPSESAGELHVLMRYQSNEKDEFSRLPTELVVELEGGDAALADALGDALSVLGQGLMQRQGTAATWTLVQAE